MAENDKTKFAGFVLVIVLVIGSAIALAQKFFPVFLVLSVVFAILTLGAYIVEFIFFDSYGKGFFDYIATYIGGITILLLIGIFLSWFIGFGLGGTHLGMACLDIYDSFNKVDEEVQQAIDDVVAESCKTLPVEQCASLKTALKTARTLEDVKDVVGKYQKVSKAVS